MYMELISLNDVHNYIIPHMSIDCQWCARKDLNLHALRHQLLKLACLPIPPLAHTVYSTMPGIFCKK